jgi:hypothetical protein
LEVVMRWIGPRVLVNRAHGQVAPKVASTAILLAVVLAVGGVVGLSADPASAATSAEISAVNWAVGQVGQTSSGGVPWYELCLTFVVDAYGDGAGPTIPIQALAHPVGGWNGQTDPQKVWAGSFSEGSTGGSATTPPYGSLVFFDATSGHDPEFFSHVEIMGSNGVMTGTPGEAGQAVFQETLAQHAAVGDYNTYVGWWLPDGTSGPPPPPPAPTAPRALQASTDHVNSVTLTWSPPTSGGNGGLAEYEVFRNGAEIGATSGAVTSYEDNAISPGSQYSYWVLAVDATGDVSPPSSSVGAVMTEKGQGSFEVRASFGSTYCREVGGPKNNVNSFLRCTVLNGTTWTNSTSGIEDWGASTGWAWVSDHGNPAYCRQVGSGPNNVQSYLKCTVFNGTTWTDHLSGIEDWGFSTGSTWVSDNGNPAYCRQVGSGPNNVQSYLKCTVFNGTTWTDEI